MLLEVGEISFVVDKLLAGLVAGRDFAVPSGGPGSYLLFATLTELFSPFLESYWSVVLFLRVGVSALALELGRRILPFAWPVLPLACLLVAPGPLSSSFFVAGTLSLALAFVHYLRAPGWRRAMALGLVVLGVGFFCLDLGVFGVFGTAAVCLSSKRRRPHLSFGLLPPLAALALALSSSGVEAEALAAMAGRVWVEGVGVAAGSSAHPGGRHLVFLGLPLVVYVVLLVRWRRPTREPAAPLLLAGLGILVLRPLGGAMDFAGFLDAAPLLYFAVALVLSGPREGSDDLPAGGRSPKATGLAVALAALLPIALATHTGAAHRGLLHTGSWTIPHERTVLLETRIGSAWLTPAEHAELEPLLVWLERDAPPGPLWVPTDQPLYYALSGRPDVTGHASLDSYADSEADQDRVLSRLQRARPPVAVVRPPVPSGADGGPSPGEGRLEAAAPRVHAYLVEHYEEVRRFGSNRVFLRRSSTPAQPSNR